MAAIPGRKLFNALLAILQMPHATMLCTASDWQRKWGRRIAPEQRPLVLLFPFGPVEFVFDVSQTEPTAQAVPLPIDVTPFAMKSLVQAGELVARLIDALIESGVRVVRARQGVALAGKIRRTEDGGSQRLPGRKSGEPDREVLVRWVVAINDSHSPTEQLATLSHELGHLYCGHVGADHGDSWPSRDVPDPRTREFEAESVARLVFRRIAPGAELPPYLEQILQPGEPLPDHGWTSVAQAADMVIELLGSLPSPVAPPHEGERASTPASYLE